MQKRGSVGAVTEGARTPVAVRITRPYSSEEDFLTHEAHTLSKAGMVLLGAPSKPVGVVLRFEVTLANGNVLMRGEGRVVAFKENVIRDIPGLTLKFTRLDPKSKAVVDRAAVVREARAKGEPTPPPSATATNEPAIKTINEAPPPSSASPSRAPASSKRSLPPPLPAPFQPLPSRKPPPIPVAAPPEGLPPGMTVEAKARADSVVPPALDDAMPEADPFPAPPPAPIDAIAEAETARVSAAPLPDFSDRSEDAETKAEPIRSNRPAAMNLSEAESTDVEIDAAPFLEKLRARAKALSPDLVSELTQKK